MASCSSSNKRGRGSIKKHISTLASSAAAEEIGYNNDILTEILKRLPAKSLFMFKQVSKSWRDLISSAALSKFWEPKPTSGLYICKSTHSKCRDIKYYFISLDGDYQSKPSSKALLRSLAFISDPVQILQSCNGLLLCCSPEVIKGDQSTSIYYICNPITKQFTALPRPHGNREDGTICSVNLAVCFSQSLQYKVVAISAHSGQGPTTTFQIEIYSSETRTWRLSGDTFEAKPNDIVFKSGVFWNSAVHWPSYTSETVPYFNLNKECFGSMPMPPFQGTSESRSLFYFGVSNGHLHLVDFNGSASLPQFVVFEMKNNNSEWFVRYLVDFSAVDIRSFKRVAVREGSYTFDLLSLVRREVEEESFMVFHCKGTCFAYNLTKGTSRKLCDVPVRGRDAMALWMEGWPLVHQHIDIPFWV